MEHGFTGDAEALRNAASSYFEDFRLDVLGRSRGYSESEFARVEASTGTWLLRRWPPGFGEGRLRFVHQALLESRSRGFRGVPSLAKTADGDTVARMAGYLYDAQEWTAGRSLSGMPGGDGPAPNVAARVPPRTLLALAEAVARFHASTARLRPELAPEVEPLAIRLGELGSELDRSLPALGAGVRDRADDTTRGVATGWLGLLPQTLGSAREASLSLDGDREAWFYATVISGPPMPTSGAASSRASPTSRPSPWDHQPSTWRSSSRTSAGGRSRRRRHALTDGSRRSRNDNARPSRSSCSPISPARASGRCKRCTSSHLTG